MQKIGIQLNLSHGLLASEFAFFAEDLAKLESQFSRHKKKGTARNFLNEAQNYFRRRLCPHDYEGAYEGAYESLRTQTLSFIHDYLTAQKQFHAVTVSESHAWDCLREHLFSVRIPHSALALDRHGIFFGRPQDLIGCQVAHLGIVGLQDHNYPPKVVPDPILTDDERSALNERIEHAAFHHELRLSNPTELQKDLLETISLSVENSLFLAFESHDLATGGISLPSSFLNRVLSAFGFDMSAEALYEIAEKIPASFFPRISKSNPFVEYDEHLASVGQTGPHFARWVELLKRRGSRERNPEDGVAVPTSQTTLLQTQYSPSSIADFFACPYRFYLRKVAGVKGIETQTRDELQWLDAMNRGTVIHAVFEGWVQVFLKGEKSSQTWNDFLKKDAPELLDSLLITASTEFEADKAGLPQFIIDTELAEIRELALEFVRREIKDTETTGFYPIGAEVEFENLTYSWVPPATQAGTQAGTQDAISLVFKGIVDRLDTDGKGTYRVIDYKTGKNRFKDASNLFQDDGDYVHFQHAIYALWVKSQSDLKASDAKLIAGYYFTSDTGGWERIEAPFEKFEAGLSATMSVFHASLKSGDFPKNHDACKYCDYRLVCGGIQEQRKNFTANTPRLELIKKSLIVGEAQ